VRRGTSGGKALNKFDRIFWKRVWSLIGLYWFSNERRPGVKLESHRARTFFTIALV
jgi:hypothetical protein